jgi:NarL family two-component system response regulator LiaR
MGATDSIRVLIVDDHAVVRSGLADFLLAEGDDLALAGEARDGQEAVSLCRTLQPDVVLMDLVMPGMDGATATRHIRLACPAIQVIALTSFREQDLVQGALKAGAIGYLLKNVTSAELASAIRAAHAGRPTLAPEAAQVLIQATQAPPPPGHDLTPREREVLSLMVRGLNNTEIAARLVISNSTAKFHVSSILSKLGAGSRTEAVALAVRGHIVDKPGIGPR